MSHIAVDLKVIEQLAPDAARGAGVNEDRILGGLNRLWLRCWSKKTDTVTPAGLAGVFGPDRIEAIGPALVEQGLLEPIADGWRVKGADRYLRIQTGRSKGGKAAAGNLKRGKKSPAASRLPPGSPPADSRLLSGLSLSTEHRALSTEEAKDPAGEKPPAPPKPEKPADPRHAPLVKALCEAIPEYTFDSGRDAKQVTLLLAKGPPDEVVLRWRRAWAWPLKFPRVRTLTELVTMWPHFATDAPAASKNAPTNPDQQFPLGAL